MNRRRHSLDYDDQQRYNDEYYAKGTTFDRIGNRLSNGRNAYYDDRDDRYYDDRRQSRPRSRSQYDDRRYDDRRYDDRMNPGGYNQQNTYTPNGRRTDPVEQIVYQSAILNGKYHNLDNPKTDTRTFVNGEEQEDQEAPNET